MYRLWSWAIIILQDARGTEYFEILNVLATLLGRYHDSGTRLIGIAARGIFLKVRDRVRNSIFRLENF